MIEKKELKYDKATLNILCQTLPEKEFKYNQTLTKFLFVVSIFTTFGFGALIITGVRVNILLLLPLIFYFLLRNMTIFKGSTDQFEFKYSPLIGVKTYKYADIKDIQILKNKMIIKTDKAKNIIIPLNIFNAVNRIEVANYLTEKIHNESIS